MTKANKFSLLLLATVAVGAATEVAYATPINEGSILSDYAIVSVGPNASIMVNSGPINGAVLLGDGTTTSSSGGGSSAITGGVWDSGTVNGDNLQHIQTPPTVHVLPASVGTTAFNDALALSTTAAGLSPNQTFTGTVSGALTINGIANTTKVVDFASLQNPLITINGNSTENFVFNVSGLFNTNRAMILNGVTASQILWNFTGTSGHVLQTSGGDTLDGIFLATDGGSFQFSSLNLDGQLINTDGHMQFVSNSKSTFSAPTKSVPEPSTLLLFGAGLAGAATLRRRRNKAMRA